MNNNCRRKKEQEQELVVLWLKKREATTEYNKKAYMGFHVTNLHGSRGNSSSSALSLSLCMYQCKHLRKYTPIQ